MERWNGRADLALTPSRIHLQVCYTSYLAYADYLLYMYNFLVNHYLELLNVSV
jgi:hypothetical protein